MFYLENPNEKSWGILFRLPGGRRQQPHQQDLCRPYYNFDRWFVNPENGCKLGIDFLSSFESGGRPIPHTLWFFDTGASTLHRATGYVGLKAFFFNTDRYGSVTQAREVYHTCQKIVIQGYGVELLLDLISDVVGGPFDETLALMTTPRSPEELAEVTNREPSIVVGYRFPTSSQEMPP